MTEYRFACRCSRPGKSCTKQQKARAFDHLPSVEHGIAFRSFFKTDRHGPSFADPAAVAIIQMDNCGQKARAARGHGHDVAA